jgi:cellobiose phosphorylase
LDEIVPFLTGRDVPDDVESIYDQFPHAAEPGDLYEHCRRSIRNATKQRGYGRHGLPLIGCGDWNDGMNLIGEHGRGESVWMAFFLMTVMVDFLPVAKARGDHDFVAECEGEIEKLRTAVDAEAWDGLWYKRAYFDDGTPLGSSENTECQIDALPQSWSILTGLTDPDRAKQAMEAVDNRLVRRDAGLIQLFDPPFDKCEVDPGYIKGYLPGVRENGGQYTHAAVWTVMAFAEMGDWQRAWELFGMINPVRHGERAEVMAKYKVEPYVVAADVYGVHPHVGRGGWTWYTGSAGWLYRLAVEHLLGIRLEIDHLAFKPLLPPHWQGYKLTYRHHGTPHRVEVKGSGRHVVKVTLDGKHVDGDRLPLASDGKLHEAVVELGDPAEAAT